MRPLFINLLIVSLSLGTAWAVRGKFGHEQGAAWAGAIGAIAILLISRREDWNAKFIKASLAAAIGWGLGGMMSYGLVVGYGKGLDFGNVYYGLCMLFVIGGLYGYLGGGLFGLVLEESEEKPVRWAELLGGMTASGILGYFFLVMQWEWFMTPPRSELWAACLGGAFFLTWFHYQHHHPAALRVAFYSGLGGGLGFAFGNFLQVLGLSSSIEFGFWNVMEYSLGFFGGLGMAYGVFSTHWPKSHIGTAKNTNLVPLLILVLFIPMVIWDQSFNLDRLSGLYGAATPAAYQIQLIALGILVLQAIYLLWGYFLRKSKLCTYSFREIYTYFLVFFFVYILLSFLKTGTPILTQLPEQYLYLLNLAVILVLLRHSQPQFESGSSSYWGTLLVLCLLFFALLAIILIHSHGELPNTPVRFGATPSS